MANKVITREKENASYEKALGFYNMDLVLKDGSKVRLTGVPHNSKLKGKPKALLDLLTSAGKTVSVNLEISYQEAGNEDVTFTLEDL